VGLLERPCRTKFEPWGGVERIKEMLERDVAWLAGLFDGEGCVWSRWPKRKNVIVEIKMTHRETIAHVNRLFPGRFSEGTLSRGSFSIKRQWRWSLDTNGSRRFLVLVLPYLITKREEAEIALRLCDRTGTEDLTALAAALQRARV
jgi:hypothetical protein